MKFKKLEKKLRDDPTPESQEKLKELYTGIEEIYAAMNDRRGIAGINLWDNQQAINQTAKAYNQNIQTAVTRFNSLVSTQSEAIAQKAAPAAAAAAAASPSPSSSPVIMVAGDHSGAIAPEAPAAAAAAVPEAPTSGEASSASSDASSQHREYIKKLNKSMQGMSKTFLGFNHRI